jgi:hypothetical protein
MDLQNRSRGVSMSLMMSDIEKAELSCSNPFYIELSIAVK